MSPKQGKGLPPGVDKDQSQWIMFLPETVQMSNPKQSPSLCKLRNPKTELESMYLFSDDNKSIYDVLRFRETYRSWLVDDSVQSDGSVLLPTAVDPLYLLIPFLMKASKSSKFMPLEQIVEDADFPECHRLTACVTMDQLGCVADTKGSDDFQVYRYNEEKTLSWLKEKVERLVKVLTQQRVNTSSTGACSSTYVKSHKTTDHSPEEVLNFAHGMVSEYLPDALCTTLKDFLGVKDLIHEKPDIEEPHPKRSKKNIAPSEDYSKQNSNSGKGTQKAGRSTLAQKQLDKVDRSGMKSISSFFSPKAAKR